VQVSGGGPQATKRVAKNKTEMYFLIDLLSVTVIAGLTRNRLKTKRLKCQAIAGQARNDIYFRNVLYK